MPAAAGVAIEVPLISMYWPLRRGRSGTVEMMPTPGAVQATPLA